MELRIRRIKDSEKGKSLWKNWIYIEVKKNGKCVKNIQNLTNIDSKYVFCFFRLLCDYCHDHIKCFWFVSHCTIVSSCFSFLVFPLIDFWAESNNYNYFFFFFFSLITDIISQDFPFLVDCVIASRRKNQSRWKGGVALQQHIQSTEQQQDHNLHRCCSFTCPEKIGNEPRL